MELSLENKIITKVFFLILTIVLLPLSSLTVRAESELTDLQKMDERLTDIELHSLRNKINFGLDFKIDSAIMNDKTANVGSAQTSHSGFVNALLFRLNADSKVGENVSFFGSVESLSFFNSSINANPEGINNRETQAKGEKVTVTKAYFDWKFYENWMIFSAGRLPTTQGPPAQLKDGLSREGTYPTMAYSMPLDGFALSSKLSTPFNMDNSLTLRLIYEPGGVVDTKNPQLGVSLGDPNKSKILAQPTNLFTAMLEYEQDHSSNGLWEKMLGIVQVGYYKFGAPPAFNVISAPSGGPVSVIIVHPDNAKFLDFKTVTPYIEFNKIFKTQFDFYATANFQWSEGFSNLKYYSTTGATTGGDLSGYGGPLLFIGKKIEHRFITGTRYEFSDKYFLGVEYMKSTMNALPTNLYTNSAFTPNLLNGNSQEVYLLKNMYNENFSIRLGYTHVNVYSNIANLLGYVNTVEKINVADLSFNIKI